MEPGKAKIVLNGGLDEEQISTIVRHELLHEWLNHGPRGEKFRKENPQLNPEFDPKNVSNIAADFEISNLGYTENDKSIARRIKLGDQVLRGLVTEDKYPDWQRMTYEEMYKELLERSKEDREQLKNLLDQLSKLTQKDLDDLQDDIDQQSQESESEQSQDNLDKLSKEIGNIKKELDKEEQSQPSQPIDTPKEQDKKEDLAKRVEAIKKAFEDEKQRENAIEDARKQKQIEKQAKIKQASDRMRVSPLHKFKVNLNNFIANQLEEIEDETYTKLNPSYEDKDFIIPGTKYIENKRIPVINVYHDTSGSFTSHPEKQEMVDKVISTLQKYERDGDIKLNRYYHASRVAPTREQAGASNNGNAVMEHIKATKPDNVIITTDGDLSDTSIPVTVPGAVWMIFFDSESDGLIRNLKGKKETKIYDI
jgi:hypothetical protein